MKSYSDKKCSGCPYRYRIHLMNTEFYSLRSEPLNLENNNSKILLLFQSPGEEEWRAGGPLQDIKKVGGTAGSRIMKYLTEEGFKRENFDITNAILCFQGKNQENKRDKDVMEKAIKYCSMWLKDDIDLNEYEVIIYFGNKAEKSLNIIYKNKIPENFKKLNHPSGGMKSEDLKKILKELKI